MAVNRDVSVAIFLLAVCGILWWASFDIRVPDYGQLSPTTWPRIILGALTLLSFIYLIQSIRAAGSSAVAIEQPVTDTVYPELNPGSATDTHSDGTSPAKGFSIGAFYHYWKNVLWCFVLFGLYLYMLPRLGMLLGALAFVFLLLCALGGWHPRKLLLHAAIALVTVGGMWSLFTYGLGVLLPTGSLFDSF